MKYSTAIAAGFALATLIMPGCKNKTEEEKKAETTITEQVKINVPAFDADTAYTYVAKVAGFGPRTPGSKAQRQAAEWMRAVLKEYCDTVYTQDVKVTGGDGKQLPCINLIGSINPQATERILFLTHWDSRPWADQDTKDKDKPIVAADDGGSGVGVLLEVAKVIKANKLPANLGIDILFTDVEDYGRTEWGEESYCLGTQYWAKHPHVPGYKAMYGVLLDMVGAHDARFPMEGFSTKYAGDVQQRIWQAAGAAGYSSYFPFVPGPDITDDHVPVNTMTGIKTVDVISLRPDPENPFPAHWHTHGDVMDVIDRNTLKAVGQTMLQMIYQEAADAKAQAATPAS